MRFNKEIKIGSFIISEQSKVFIIAEAGVNHCGDIEIAKKLIEVAKESGANAVKFQAYKTENIILNNVEKAPYQNKSDFLSKNQFDMLKRLELSNEENKILKVYCKNLDIIFLTTPYDEDSLNDLDELPVDAYKIASTDLTNIPFLIKVAKKNKPIIISTGMSYLQEVELSLREIGKINRDIILLQCISSYPTKLDEVNLKVINSFKEKFDILVGFSDHTNGVGASPYAVALGAKVIEKHFTLDKNLDGPDHKASLNPNELKKLVDEIRKVESYLGSGLKMPTFSEIENRKFLQKYLVAKMDIKKGTIITENLIVAKRTGGAGISPIYYRDIIGKKAKRDYKEGDFIQI